MNTAADDLAAGRPLSALGSEVLAHMLPQDEVPDAMLDTLTARSVVPLVLTAADRDYFATVDAPSAEVLLRLGYCPATELLLLSRDAPDDLADRMLRAAHTPAESSTPDATMLFAVTPELASLSADAIEEFTETPFAKESEYLAAKIATDALVNAIEALEALVLPTPKECSLLAATANLAGRRGFALALLRLSVVVTPTEPEHLAFYRDLIAVTEATGAPSAAEILSTLPSGMVRGDCANVANMLIAKLDEVRERHPQAAVEVTAALAAANEPAVMP